MMLWLMVWLTEMICKCCEHTDSNGSAFLPWFSCQLAWVAINY